MLRVSTIKLYSPNCFSFLCSRRTLTTYRQLTGQNVLWYRLVHDSPRLCVAKPCGWERQEAGGGGERTEASRLK